jgi:prevent-host-death family protein
MLEANVRQTKAKLSTYLALVEQGEEILIVRRGRPIAILKPVEKPTRLDSMKGFRERIQLKGSPASETIIKMREESKY